MSALAAALLLIGMVTPASAQDWEYRVRSGDTLWELAEKHMRSPAQWPQLQEYNQVEDPWNMRPGTRVNFPIAWLRIAPAPVQVTALTGQVWSQRHEGASQTAVYTGQQLTAGAVLTTDREASATLRFADGSRMQVLPESSIIFDTLSAFGETGMVDTRMRLQYGRVESRVERARGPASRFILATPPAISSVRGTELRVALDEHSGVANTEVPSGEVEVQSGEQRYQLSAGQGVLIEPDRSPTQPRALLPAPELAPLAGTVWRTGEIVAWSSVAGALSYRLQLVDVDSDLVSADVIVDTTQAPLPSVDNGDYLLRVRAIATDGLEGLDATSTLAVHAKPEPPFVLQPGPEDRLNPGRVRFRWTRSESAVSYRLQLDDNQEFSSPLIDQRNRRTTHRPRQSLDEGVYFWRIAAIDEAGDQGPFGNIERLEIRSGPASPELRKPRRSKARWQTGASGHHYQVQIAGTPDFQDPVIDTTVTQPEIDLADLELPRGRFYIRVREVDGDGYPGPFGPVQEVNTACWACRGGILGAVIVAILLL